MPVKSLNSDCQRLYNQGKYKECLALVEETGVEQLPAAERIEALLVAAKIKRELTDLAGAVKLLEKAKELAATNNDTWHELEAALILNAVLASQAGDKEAAKKYVVDSELLLNRVKQLERGERYDRLYVLALCELGMAKICADDIALAAQNLRVASGYASDKFGSESVEMLYPSLCLSIVHAREDKHTLSLVMARNATQIARANFGKHPIVIQPLYRLAQAAFRLGLMDLALENCRQVEGKIEEFIGEESDIYVDVLGMKTAAFTFVRDLPPAEQMASRRLKIMEKMRGKNSPKLIDPLCDMAQVLAYKGERDKAEKYFDRALNLVTELARNQGFPESDDAAGKVADVPGETPDSTLGTRLKNSSLCHLEYNLIENLSDCYLWQGKIADAAKLMPASYRASHTCRIDRMVSLIDSIHQHFLERARNLDLPQ
ncbi:MAG: hypothetical protein JSS86_10840 [Cyanobacteria bacterium SZAS LIN-2]|nr:hypothetical protein [Cyanobacteria bacterium SZAS LIN-2]